MEKQFNYIIEIASEYEKLSSNEDQLFDRLYEIKDETLQNIYEEYTSSARGFEPVNMLRAKAAVLLMEKNITAADVEEIKTKIRDKDTEYFSEFPEKQIEGMKAYVMGKRDMFANWQNLWSIFHQFFFRGTVKQTIEQYLNQIGGQLLEDLELEDYEKHTVSFAGPSNFGSTQAWIALYPIQKYDHRHGYQFFVGLYHEPVAGLVPGHSLEDDKERELRPVSSYTDVVSVFQDLKEKIISLNKKARNYFKFSPGVQAEDWDWFYENSVIGIDYEDLEFGDISNVESRQELNEIAGFDKDSMSNQTWNTWLFKTANIGDVVFVNHGRDTVLGIGIVTGEYRYKSEQKYAHQREVKWLTRKVYEYKSETFKKYRSLFRPDTFSPTKISNFILSEYARLYPDLADVFKKNGLQFTFTEPEIDDEPYDEPEELEENVDYWWLNANPKMWSISEYNEGDRQTYTARNERGNKRRIYKYFETVKPGDLLIGYESTPVKQIRAIMRITKGLHHSDDEGEVIEFEITEKLDVPVHWDDLKHDPSLKECEVFINNQGSLFSLTEDEYEIIQSIIDENNITAGREFQTGESKPYDYESDEDKPFISKEEFLNIHSILERKKNIILQGPPGVGKTFIARKLAYHHMGKKNDAQIEMVQFHQSYSYEDFVQGIRLTNSGTEVRNGIFYTFCQQAHAHPKKPFFLIIDEINRGNLSKIFGELLMLIENNKRSNKFATKLTYALEKEDTFFVPDNIYLIGTMNTADRSLAILDYALRRRFAFVNLRPIYDDKFKKFLVGKGMSESLAEHISQSVVHLNHEIENDDNLGSGFQIGHSYFCTYNNHQDENKWYRETLEYEIKPLLEEIWFDKLNTAEEMLARLTQ